MKRTPDQNIRFHKLIGLLGIDAEHKMELVQDASNGRETSSAELTVHEMDGLIEHLQKMVNKMDVQSQQDHVMRRKVFSIFHELGYELPGGDLDYPRINSWMLDRSYLHKLINDYKHEELPKLVTQVENMLIKSYK